MRHHTYSCNRCGHLFRTRRQIAHAEQNGCPCCGSHNIECEEPGLDGPALTAESLVKLCEADGDSTARMDPWVEC